MLILNFFHENMSSRRPSNVIITISVNGKLSGRGRQ